MSRLDLDRILSEEERIPCVFDSNGASGLGFLDVTSDSQDLYGGARVELPLWMALALARKRMVSMELPRHYQKKMRDNISAGAESINLKEFSPYFFEVGVEIAALLDADLKDTLRVAFTSERYRQLMNHALCSTIEENTDFANDLTVREAQIYHAGIKAAREMENWRKQRSGVMKKSGILAKRTHSALAPTDGTKKKQ